MATTNSNAPLLDNLATKRQLHQMFIQNVVQKLIHKNGRGITDQYATDVKTDEIRVLRIKASTAGFRTLGATGTNVSSFNKMDFAQPISDHYMLRLRTVFDLPYEIAQVQMDMLPLDIIGGLSTVLEQRVSKLINAFTMAVQIATALNQADDAGIVPLVETTGTVLQAFLTANAKLDQGDTDNGQDVFELTSRLGVLRGDAIRQLKTSEGAVFDMNNVTSQELLRLNALSSESADGYVINNRVDGYRGDVDGVPIAFAPDTLFTLAETWLSDVSAGDLDDVLGIVCASEATARGIDFGGIEIDKHPTGRGVLLKPLFRWGVEVFFPKGVYLITKFGFTNPVDGTTVTSTAVVAPDNSLPE